MSSNCPKNETIAAFIDGRLDTTSRSDLEEHLASCDACLQVLSGALVVTREIEESSDSTARDDRRRRMWRLSAAGLIAASLIVALIWIPRARQPSATDLQNDLVAAVSDRGVLDVRLSGGYTYPPAEPTTRGLPLDDADPSSWSVRAAAERIVDTLAEKLDEPSAGRAVGQALLILGRPDDAVAALQEAASSSPNDAGVSSDLAAAYLTLDVQSESTRLALEAALRAIELDNTLVEAWFNRALAEQRRCEMSNDDAACQSAAKAWDDYVELDPDSAWAAHAERLRALGR